MLERNFYLGFSNFPGIGPIKFEKLLKHFGNADAAWYASNSDLQSIIGEKLTAKFINFRKTFEIERYLEKLEKEQVSFVCLTEKEYPQRLKNIKNPPIILYSKGKINFNSEQKFLAIVGTRHMTSYGRSVTDLFAGNLASSGLVIVSGLALGVDAQAHISSLNSRGKTIAVLGSGVDICFPRENQKIYDRILNERGMIISEYPLGEKPSIGSFPARNRIVAGLSDGILVTEGAQDSGSLITANFGLEFGRKVFAIPGPITSSLSAAPLRLIEKGAKLVVSPDDVTRELGLKINDLRMDKKMFKNLTKDEQKIIDLLQNESLHFDEIVSRLKIDSAGVGTLLSMMEIKGILRNVNGKFLVVF